MMSEMKMEEFLVTERQPTNHVNPILKYLLLSFSLIFWAVGALFAAVGGWTISQKTGYQELSDFVTDPGAILGALGVAIFSVSTFGVMGAIRENMCYLRLYKICLVSTLVFELCAGMVGFAFWPEGKRMMQYKIKTAIQTYMEPRNYRLRNLIDTIQREFECCGALTIDDWDSNSYFRCKIVASYRSCGVPWSCCLKKFERNRQCGYNVRGARALVAVENIIHTRGCLDKGFEFLKNHMLLIGALAIAFTLPLIGGIFMADRLIKQIWKTLRDVDPVQYELMKEKRCTCIP